MTSGTEAAASAKGSPTGSLIFDVFEMEPEVQTAKLPQVQQIGPCCRKIRWPYGGPDAIKLSLRLWSRTGSKLSGSL